MRVYELAIEWMELTRCLVPLVLFTILHSKANKPRCWIFIEHKLVICYPITWLQRYVVPRFRSRVHRAGTLPLVTKPMNESNTSTLIWRCFTLLFIRTWYRFMFLRGNRLKNVSETVYLATIETTRVFGYPVIHIYLGSTHFLRPNQLNLN